MLKNDDPKNQWMKDLYKLESINDIYKNLNNSAIIEEKLIKRPKKIPTSLSAKIREDNNEKERKEKKEKNKKNKKAYDEDDIENQRVVKIDYLKELPEIRKKMEEEMKKKKRTKKEEKTKTKTKSKRS